MMAIANALTKGKANMRIAIAHKRVCDRAARRETQNVVKPCSVTHLGLRGGV